MICQRLVPRLASMAVSCICDRATMVEMEAMNRIRMPISGMLKPNRKMDRLVLRSCPATSSSVGA